jgi:hypothetical protein
VAHDPARRLALDVLCAVRERGAYANLLLPQLMRERRLPARDRAFATELTYGSLRAQGSLDASLDRFIQRSVDPAVRDALRLGAYQMWRTRVPARAAVSTTVDLVRSVSPRAAGFANAVMRRVSEHPEPPAPAYDTTRAVTSRWCIRIRAGSSTRSPMRWVTRVLRSLPRRWPPMTPGLTSTSSRAG